MNRANRPQRGLIGACALAVVLGMASIGLGQLPANGGAPVFQVFEVRGDAKWGVGTNLKADSETGWRTVRVGDKYPRETQIRTGLRTKVKLVMVPAKPATIVMVEPLTLASIDELLQRDGKAVTRLGLAYGAIRAGVAEGELRNDLQIRAPVATLSKRGTWGFRLYAERGTGRWEMSLSERGLVEAIQNLTGQRRFITPGQTINQFMSHWIEAVHFTQQLTVHDPFGIKGADLLFNLNNGTGLGVLLFGGNGTIGVLNTVGNFRIEHLDLTPGGQNNNQSSNQNASSLRLSQAIQNRAQNRGPFRRPDGDFGVGFGSVPLGNIQRAFPARIKESPGGYRSLMGSVTPPGK